jgi:predicted transcriptional regulator
MIDTVEQLRQLGFGEYEARAYVALLQRSPMTGYELAKVSGLPRANVYAVLQKLEERSAVLRVDTPEGSRYAPVPAQELVERLQQQFEQRLETARRGLDELATPAQYETVWNARGYGVLLDHARTLIGMAEQRLLLAVWHPESQALAGAVAAADARGVRVVTLCMAGCQQECGTCQGDIHRYRVTPDEATRWLVVVPDESEVLAGEIGLAGEAQVVRTRQRLLVHLAIGYIRHSIALAALLNDAGGRLTAMVKPETRAILASIGPGGQQGDWLEYMSRLLSQSDQKN